MAYTDAGGIIVVLSLLGFIASHAIGQGAVIWVFISEIFPTMYEPVVSPSEQEACALAFAALITLFTLFLWS